SHRGLHSFPTRRSSDLKPGQNRAFFLAARLAGAVGDATLAQIIGGQFHANLVTGKNPDVVLAHLSGDVRSNDVPVFQLHTKHGRSEEHTSELQSRENLV